MLNLLIFLPMVGGFLIWLLLRRSAVAARWAVLAVALVEAVICLKLWATMGDGFFAQVHAAWLPSFGVQYLLGMDGLSLVLALLTAVVTLGALLVAWNAVEDWAAFGALILIAEGAIMGVLCALDLVLFYVFWEVMIVPIFFLAARRGAEARRAAMRFFLFTIVGSLLMLVSLVALYVLHGQATGEYTFDYFKLLHTPMGAHLSLWLMLGMLSAFAVKIPMFPLHLWAPDTYSRAEAPVSIMLAGAMANMGAYGVMRFCLPLFPAGAQIFAPWGMALGAIGVVYAGLLALVQNDLKRVIAYSSVSHMSLVVLGLFAWQRQALDGAVFLLLAHGIGVLGLFAVTAWIEARGRSMDLDGMGGWFKLMPRMGILFLICLLAGVGLPGLANFVGEFLVLAGGVEVNLAWSVVAALGILVSVMYFLRAYERSMLGPLREEIELRDLGVRETFVMGATALLLLWLGLFPQVLLSPVGAVTAALAQMH
ncbi:MAG: NADH-quinone oxidoreductase subunit M [Acidihalobacter sp.]|uniref:complex I subunit 4 family protein n=1 Tax=Acidihalobacter sp. TaxID=1872108 RepID=UPI00307E985E